VVLSNSRQVLQAWLRALSNPSFRLALIRHAPKDLMGGPHTGLSNKGKDQANHMGGLLSNIRPLMRGELLLNVALSSTSPVRNTETLERIFGPPEIRLTLTDMFNCGLDDIDLVNARRIVETNPGITLGLVLECLEQYGIERQGETPSAARERIAAGYVDLMQRYPDRPVIHCMNSPTGNEAIGIYGMMEELETIFFSYHAGDDPPFQEIGRITPIFTD